VGLTYATVGTVCAAALLGSLVDLDVLYDQIAGVEALSIGVRFSIAEETEQELGGLDGPAGLGDAELLACWDRNQPQVPIDSLLILNPHFKSFLRLGCPIFSLV
jgi:hypothetical protein